MPPSLSKKDEQDKLYDIVSDSIATVYREINDDEVDFGPGFIIDADSKRTLVCVHKSQIKEGESLRVTFKDGTTQKADVFYNEDPNNLHSVLVVENLTGTSRSQVVFCDDPIKREEVFTIAAVQSRTREGLMSGKIIAPECTAYTEDDSYVCGSQNLFAMSCPAGGVSKLRPDGNAAQIIGAAVFNLKGQVIGTIKSIDPNGFDIKFAAKASSFVQALEHELKKLDEKILLSRSQRAPGKGSSNIGDGMTQQGGAASTSDSKSMRRSAEDGHGSANRTEKEVHVDQLEVMKMVDSAGQDDMLLKTQKAKRMPVMRLLNQVAKMLPESGVSSIFSNRKRKFGTIDGVLGGFQEFGSSSHPHRSVLSILSKYVASSWAQSVVSVSSVDEGGPVHPGIAFDRTKLRAYILTSLSLFRSTDHDRVINYRTKTKVCLPNNQVVQGMLIFHDLKHNLAIVSVSPEAGCVRAACLDHQHDQLLEPTSQVVAVWCCFNSGKLMTTTRMFGGDLMGAYRQAADGVIIIDFLGNVVGLNCYGKEGTTFIPRSTMLEFLAVFQKACAEKKARAADLKRRHVPWWEVSTINYDGIKLKRWSPSDMSRLEGSSTMENKKQSACHYCDPGGQSAPGDHFKRLFRDPSWPARGDSVYKEAARNKLRSRGYPFPVLSDRGMRLLCNFEEEFDEDIWSELPERVALDMSRSVVALASFKGDKRLFACTGIVIGCNELTTRVLTSASLVRNTDDEAKVADNLKIEVCLPDNEHVTGTLQHYNLHYNIAVISIMGSRCTHAAQIYDQLPIEPLGEVVAIGRVYESGKLIATGGTLTDKPSELDCKVLKMSTCKITKAGIGGPLIDCAGNFLGLDFYGLEETPYLPRNVVLEVLRSLDTKPDATDMINDQNPNRWPVPKPCWCYPTWHDCMGEGLTLDHQPKPM